MDRWRAQFLKSSCTLESFWELLKLTAAGVPASENLLYLSHNQDRALAGVSALGDDSGVQPGSRNTETDTSAFKCLLENIWKVKLLGRIFPSNENEACLGWLAVRFTGIYLFIRPCNYSLRVFIISFSIIVSSSIRVSGTQLSINQYINRYI